MASLDIKSFLGVVDKRKGQGTTTDPAVATLANIDDIGSMRARLTAINAATYTVDALNHMTHNDMRYAIRLNDDPTSGVNG